MHTFVGELLDVVATAVDAFTAVAITAGLLVVLGKIARAWRGTHGLSDQAMSEMRLTLARWLGLALELTLAADVLQTVMIPTWEAIGKTAAIAAIRTALNYSLQREIEHGAPRESATGVPAHA